MLDRSDHLTIIRWHDPQLVQNLSTRDALKDTKIIYRLNRDIFFSSICERVNTRLPFFFML